MNTTKKIIAYYRVSTKRQGLGLEAQRAAVMEYAAANNLTIVDEVSEKESGKEDERPGLNLAIAKARKERAALVVAKVDRISRDISFAAKIFFKSGLKVVALNLPAEASEPIIFSVYFGLAQQEAKMISERTKAALKARKEQGVKLGRPDAKEWANEIRPAAAKARKEAADTNPANLAAANELRRYFATVEGKRNLSAAARHLNEMQLYTSRGVFHDAKSVKLLIARFNL